MKNKKSISKWIKAIVMILLASLIYAVYFTELGKPESSASEKGITIYDQTALPTIFAETSRVPTVELDWAFASNGLLKFAISVRGLETDLNPSDLICNPHITIDKPVPRRLSGYEMRTVYDTSGESIQATYEYEINASGYDLLAIEMDTTIGPCADYLNFQETNVTLSAPLPDLIANYHLSFQVPVKISTPSLSLTPRSTAMDVWRDLPIFPGGIESNDTTADHPIYHYIIENADVDAVQRFYKGQMQATGWQLLGTSDMGGADIGKAYALWFAKAQDIVTIDVFAKENMTHVIITLE
jgi:hypothetical protein